MKKYFFSLIEIDYLNDWVGVCLFRCYFSFLSMHENCVSCDGFSFCCEEVSILVTDFFFFFKCQQQLSVVYLKSYRVRSSWICVDCRSIISNLFYSMLETIYRSISLFMLTVLRILSFKWGTTFFFFWQRLPLFSFRFSLLLRAQARTNWVPRFRP